MKYPPAPLTPFFASLPLTRPHRFLRHARPSRTAQVLSAGASIACALLNSLASLFAAAVLYFQSFAHSFAKYPGYGVSRSDWWALGGSRRRLPMPETVVRDTRGGYGYLFCSLDHLSALSPLPLITSLQPLRFHALTHSFAQRRPAKPCPLKRLRTLSITTGVVPPRCSGFSLDVSSGGQRCYLQ